MSKENMLVEFVDPFLPPPLGFTRYTGDIRHIEELVRKLEYKPNVENSITTDTYLLDRPEFSDLKQYISDFIHVYTERVFKSRQQIEIKQSWCNWNLSGESHPKHIHPNSYLSGVMFIKSDENSAPLMIENHLRPYYLYVDLWNAKEHEENKQFPPDKYSSLGNSAIPIPPIEGNIVLFPSPTPHLVPQNPSSRDRLTLAFNTFPKLPFGSEGDATYVY